MRTPRSILLPLLAVASALLLAACGSDEPTAAPTTAPTATPTTAPGATPRPTATPTPEPTFDAEAHFDGKTVSIAVGFAPGGGYDTFARLVGKHLNKYLPGDVRFIVRNLAGAGGERVFEAIEKGSADGLTVAVVHPRFVKRELLGDDVDHFDLQNAKWIGTASAVCEGNAYYVFKETATSWDQVIAEDIQLTAGATAPGDTGGVGPTFVETLGGPLKMIYGYGGTSEISAAFDRGEITGSSRGNYTSAPRLFPEWVENQRIVPLFRWGCPPEGDPLFSEYITSTLGAEIPPHVFDIMNPTEGQKAVFNVTETINDNMTRMFMAASDTPDEVHQVWVDAFEALTRDAAFTDDALIAGYTVGHAGPTVIAEVLAQGSAAIADSALRDLFITLAGAE